MDPKEEDDNAVVKLTASAVVISLIACLGLISNIIGICTIWKIPKRCKLFNNMIICLLAFDCWFLITAPFFFFGLNHEFFQCKFCAWLVPYWAVPFGHASFYATLMMTLAISHERYLAIRNPLNYNQSLISEGSQRKRLLMYLIPTFILSVGLSVPRFLNFEIQTNTTTNELTVNLTRLGCDKDYLFYNEFLVTTIGFGVIPWLVLIFLSFQTLKILRAHNKQMKRSGITDRNTDIQRSQEEDSMAKVMVGLVVIFLVCHFLRICINTIIGITGRRSGRCEGKHEPGTLDSHGIVVQLSVFMVMVNSAIGTITYCVINAEFRNHLKDMFKCISRMRNIPEIAETSTRTMAGITRSMSENAFRLILK